MKNSITHRNQQGCAGFSGWRSDWNVSVLHFNPFFLQKSQSFIFLSCMQYSPLLCFQSGLPDYCSIDSFSLATRFLMCFQQSLNLWTRFTAESIVVLHVAFVISKEQLFEVTSWFCNSGLQISLKIKTSLLNEWGLRYLKIRISSCRKIDRPFEFIVWEVFLPIKMSFDIWNMSL